MQEPKAKKSLGQNFLQDKNIARKIVEALQIARQDEVIEIGPGPGMLTRFILEERPASLTLLEKDNDMSRVWNEAFADGRSEQGVPARVLNMDALRFDWASLSNPVKIIGNLPYNVASPLMWDIVRLAPGLRRAVFMVQKEVGERLCAVPSTGAYGALSVWVQSFARPRFEFTVPPQVFRPRPKVHSAVISFEPLPLEERVKRPEVLSFLLKMFFQQRRKQMGGILKSHGYSPELLEEQGISPCDRPESLFVDQFKALSDKFLIKK